MASNQELVTERERHGSLAVFRSNLLWISPLVLALLSVICWHIRNRAWPTDDAANYMTTAYQEYLAFKLQGFESGLKSLDTLRGWRPIFFPPLAVPFLVVTGGNIVASAAMTVLTGYFGFVLYVFAIARRYLSLPYSVAATVSVTTLPPFVTYALIFFSEIWWLFFSIAWLYHVIASHDLRNRRQATVAGLFLGLAFMIRPAETIAITTVPVVYFLSRFIISSARRQSELGPVFSAIVALAVIGGLLVASAFFPWLGYWILLPVGGVILASVIIIPWHMGRSLTGASCFCAVTALCNLVWWAGFMPALYSWVYSTSFGAMARVLDDHQRQGILAVFHRVFTSYASGQVMLVGALGGVVGVTVYIKRWLIARDVEKRREFAYPIAPLGIVILGMLIPILVLYAASGTTDPRRIIVVMAIIELLLAILALAPGRFRSSRAAMIWAVAAINGVGIVAAQAHIALPSDFRRAFGLDFPLAHRSKDADQEVIRRLESLDISAQRKVAVYTLALFQASARVYEPAALQLAALVAGHPDSIGYLWNEGEYSRVLDVLYQQGYRFLLLDLYDGPGGRDAHNPYVTFTSTLLDQVERGVISPPGLRRLEMFKIRGRDQVLFEIMPP